MFRLLSLEAENFRGYKYLKLDNLDTQGLTCILGKNGSGKSSIRLLLEYLLTDTTSENIPLNELTFNGKGDCRIACSFLREEDESLIEIVKYREHDDWKNKTFLGINGDFDSLTYTDRRETQKEISKLLGIDDRILNISTIFSSNSDSFPQLKESDRKKVIYDAINLHKYTPAQQKAKDKKKEIEERIEACEIDIKIKSEKLKDNKENLKSLVSQEKEFEENRKDKIQKLNNEIKLGLGELENLEITKTLISDEIKKLESKLKNGVAHNKERLLQSKAELSQKIMGLEETRQKVKEVNEKISKIESEISELSISKEQEKEFIDEQEKEKTKHLELTPNLYVELERLEWLQTKKKEKLISLKQKMKSSSEVIDKIEEGICPILLEVCDRLTRGDEVAIRKAYQRKLEKLIEKIENQIESNKVKLESCRNTSKIIEGIDKGIKDALESIDRKDYKISVLTKDLEPLVNNTLPSLKSINEDVADYDLQLREIRLELTIFEDIDKIRDEYDNKKDELNRIESDIKFLEKDIETFKGDIKKLKADKNPYSVMAEGAKKLIANLKKEVDSLTKKVEEWNTESKYYDFWVSGYSPSGLPNLEAESFLEEVQNETNKNLSSISSDMFVDIQGQSDLKSGDVREKISYRVHSRDKSIKEFYSYSGGQRQRILLADKFSFNTLLSKFNFMILDEVLELSLDEEGKSTALEMLRRKSEELGSIFVITHNSSIQDYFDNVIEVENRDGISSLVEKN